MAALIHARVQARADLKAEALSLLASVERTDEQNARLTEIETKIAALDQDIARLAKLQDDERAQATGVTAERIEMGTDRATLKPWGPEIGPSASAIERRDAEHIALGRFALAVRAHALGQGSDPRLLAVATGAGTQTDSNMGFAVPREVAPGIEREMFSVGDLLSRVDARSVTGNSIAYNLMDQTSRADGSRQGGVLGYWVDEGTAPTASNTKIQRMEMKLRKVGAFGVMTDELLDDAAALGGELQQAFAHELIFQVENKIYRGNGSSAPLGFLNAPCLISVSKETNQAAATIVGPNITKMWARMSPNSHKSAVWLANVDTIPQMAELTQPIGTGGIRYPYASVEAGSVSLWGRPVVFVEYAETVGTVGDLALVDLSKYRLIRKRGVEQASSMHVYFAQGEQAFRAFYRVDGQPVPRAALTPFKGSNTLSPFVVLATRA